MATILVATIDDCRLLTFSPREISRASASHSQVIISRGKLPTDLLAAHTGLEPVISALRGQRVNQLHQCAVRSDYRGQRRGLASWLLGARTPSSARSGTMFNLSGAEFK